MPRSLNSSILSWVPRFSSRVEGGFHSPTKVSGNSRFRCGLIMKGGRSCASFEFGWVREYIIGNLYEADRNKGTHIRIPLIVCLTIIGVDDRKSSWLDGNGITLKISIQHELVTILTKQPPCFDMPKISISSPMQMHVNVPISDYTGTTTVKNI